MKDLDEILSGSEPAQAQETIAEPTATPAPTETQTEGQPRAADGKFATKATEPDASAQQAVEGTEQPPERANVVPQQALHASREQARTERERADRLERRLAELEGRVAQTQPKPEAPKPVEFWDDPAKWGESLLTPVQEQLLETRLMVSETRALATFGQDAISAAQQAVKDAIDNGHLDAGKVQAQLRQSRDPVGDVVRWHQNSPAFQEQTLREKLRAEIMAELGTTDGQPAPVAQPAPSVMPSNLAGARNVGTRSGPAWSGPKPLNDIFDRTRAKAG